MSTREKPTPGLWDGIEFTDPKYQPKAFFYAGRTWSKDSVPRKMLERMADDKTAPWIRRKEASGK